MNAWIIFLIVVVALVLLIAGVRIVKQYERGVVLRFGRLVGVRNPGLNLIIPFIDRMTKISLRIVPFVLEPQEVITKDNVTVRVDAVVYFKVSEPVNAGVNVEGYRQAIIPLPLTTPLTVLIEGKRAKEVFRYVVENLTKTHDIQLGSEVSPHTTITIQYPAGLINSRKSQITPFLPKLV